MPHDELCPQHGQTQRSIIAFDTPCRCGLIARARADERERWGLGWIAAADNVQALAHAEAVAARLVEVIRVDDLRLRTQKGHTAQARRERDAARAEVERLQRLVAVLEKMLDTEAMVLADLRAKVDDRAHRAADIYREEGGTYWEGSMDAYGVVLSLIEEAGG